MTCFSIHKSFPFLLFLALVSGIFGLSVAMAQTPEPPPEEVAKVKARDEAQAKADLGKVDAPIVLELFTASDCTACILADRMMYDAMKDKNVIALSCHIQDFGKEEPIEELTDRRLKKQQGKNEDYIGDNSNQNTGPMDPCVFRQWSFATSNRAEDITVSIPTFYFNGYDRVDAGNLDYFKTMFDSYHYRHKNKTLEAMMRWKDKDTITIHLPQTNEKDKPNASVWLIRYKDMGVERVDEGINKGRVLRFSNIVQSVTHVGKWHGDIRTIDVDVTAPEGGKLRGGYVAVVAEMLGDRYLAAGMLVDYPVAADLKETAAQKAKAKAAKENKLKAVPSDKQPELVLPNKQR